MVSRYGDCIAGRGILKFLVNFLPWHGTEISHPILPIWGLSKHVQRHLTVYPRSLIVFQDAGVVGSGGAVGRAPAGGLSAYPPSPAFSRSSLLEVLGQIFHLQGTAHLLPR